MQQKKSKKSLEDCLSSYGNSVGKPNLDVWYGNQKINNKPANKQELVATINSGNDE